MYFHTNKRLKRRFLPIDEFTKTQQSLRYLLSRCTSLLAETLLYSIENIGETFQSGETKRDSTIIMGFCWPPTTGSSSVLRKIVPELLSVDTHTPVIYFFFMIDAVVIAVVYVRSVRVPCLHCRLPLVPAYTVDRSK